MTSSGVVVSREEAIFLSAEGFFFSLWQNYYDLLTVIMRFSRILGQNEFSLIIVGVVVDEMRMYRGQELMNY